MENLEIMVIEKERVSELKFPQEEVLMDSQAIAERNLSLKRALILGNAEKGKTKITFKDEEGVKAIETTVWGVTDSRIILKYGSVIPINRILSVH